MSINSLQIQEFMNVFSGSQHSYGEAIYKKSEKDGKVEAKCRTVTDKLLTIKEYKEHLEGTKGLGIIPIKENNKCVFSLIDVDVYDEKLEMYVESIERNNFPLVPFRSKSGGLHIYLFLKEEENTKKVIEMMRKISFLLSIDYLVKRKNNSTVEVYPKQTKLKEGEFGNWINLPYFNSKDTMQYAYKRGKELSLGEAITYIKSKQTTLKDIKEFLEELPFDDAPPCLQLLYFLNPMTEESGRNNFLFSFGVYLKKKNEEFFEQNLLEINRELKDPLEEDELERTILKSLKKKDYVYKCRENPCFSFCSKKECKRRDYGIGKDEGYFSSIETGKLFQFKSKTPYYEWEVKLQGQDAFKKLRFKSEEEIIRQDMFLKLCMRELYELPSKLKQIEWFNKVNQALKEIICVDIEEDYDTSPYILLRNLIMEFLTGRAMAETKEQVLVGRVYYNEKTKDYQFRIQDLISYIFVTKQFRYFSPQDLHGILRELKCINKTIRTESGTQVRIASFLKGDVIDYGEKNLMEPDFTKFSKEEF